MSSHEEPRSPAYSGVGRVTDKDFFNKLQTTMDIINWEVTKTFGKKTITGRIKKNKKNVGVFCPITAVFYQLKGIYRFPISAYPTGKEMGLSEEFVDKIVRAADGEENPERKQLLKALKLDPRKRSER